jgi:signal transduction histidine kinase
MGEAGEQGSGNILIVDDLPSNLRLLCTLLTARGYLVQQARDGTNALQLAQAGPRPDLIFLDIRMPGMDGYEVCQHLKTNDQTRDIPVIFISALSDSDDIVKAFKVGGADYITKPFQLDEVLARAASQLALVRQRQQIQQLRDQERQSFETLNQMRTQFLRMAMHDFRNPLNVILGYARVLERLGTGVLETERLQECIQGIELSVDKMRTLVTSMLDLAQIETRATLVMSPVPLGVFLEKCLRGFRPLANEQGVRLNFDPLKDDVIVQIDAARMERVIDNLVSNAIKYNVPGGCVEVVMQTEAGYALIQIQDSGLGIPAEDIPHIFEAFYRGGQESHEDIEGTGLGLSVVKAIVEQHKGQISVESQPGKGSLFTVRLPLADGRSL